MSDIQLKMINNETLTSTDIEKGRECALIETQNRHEMEKIIPYELSYINKEIYKLIF